MYIKNYHSNTFLNKNYIKNTLCQYFKHEIKMFEIFSVFFFNIFSLKMKILIDIFIILVLKIKLNKIKKYYKKHPHNLRPTLPR
jgi:hypothetical protein